MIIDKTVRLATPRVMCEEVNDVTSCLGGMTTVLISDSETESDDDETEQIYFENSQASIITDKRSKGTP